jgi:beta-lactamase regulating signal transducer with metallopeptidase domain
MNAGLDDGVARLGMALLHFVWQGALVGCLAAVALALLRNARAQPRYAVCGAALLLCVLLPAWQCLVPWQPPTEPVAAAAPVELDAAGLVAPRRGHTLLSAAWLQPGLPTLVLAWSLGAVLMALRLALGLQSVQRLRAAADAHRLDPAWAARLAALARRMGLRLVPRLLVADDVDGPVTVGGWRPMVLLPASLLLRMPT